MGVMEPRLHPLAALPAVRLAGPLALRSHAGTTTTG
jgi:hypothetical protein